MPLIIGFLGEDERFFVSGREFLDFHAFFHPNYDTTLESELRETFRIDQFERSGNLSAGELRRLQIVSALATRPELIIIDEITAVLDILGRVTFLKTLKSLCESNGVTIVLATNIPEGLEAYATNVLLINKGNQLTFSTINEFLGGTSSLAERTMEELASC